MQLHSKSSKERRKGYGNFSSKARKKRHRSQCNGAGMLGNWRGPTAQFKTFIDRGYGAAKVTFAGRRVVLVIPWGGGTAGYACHTLGMLTDILNYKEMKRLTTVLAPGAHALGAVLGHADVLAEARRTGREAIMIPSTLTNQS